MQRVITEAQVSTLHRHHIQRPFWFIEPLLSGLADPLELSRTLLRKSDLPGSHTIICWVSKQAHALSHSLGGDQTKPHQTNQLPWGQGPS